MECKPVRIRRGRAAVLSGQPAKSQNASLSISYMTPRGVVGFFIEPNRPRLDS